MVLTRQLQSPHPKIQRAAIYALFGKGADIHLERLRKKPGLNASIKTILDTVLSGNYRVLAGFVIADYSDNRILQIDLKGNKVSSIEQIFGCWDVEVLDNGNYLITEFSVNRVSEVTPANKTVWSFEDLKNPYDADRLPNGNTLIADTFGRRTTCICGGFHRTDIAAYENSHQTAAGKFSSDKFYSRRFDHCISSLDGTY